MKKNKSVAVVLILMIIICHLLVTFFKVNTDYFKYNYKFDKSESRNRINLNFWYNGEEYLQEYWRGLFEYAGEKTCLHVIKTVESPDTVIFVRDLIIPFQYTTYILFIIFFCISIFIRHFRH